MLSVKTGGKLNFVAEKVKVRRMKRKENTAYETENGKRLLWVCVLSNVNPCVRLIILVCFCLKKSLKKYKKSKENQHNWDNIRGD